MVSTVSAPVKREISSIYRLKKFMGFIFKLRKYAFPCANSRSLSHQPLKSVQAFRLWAMQEQKKEREWKNTMKIHKSVEIYTHTGKSRIVMWSSPNLSQLLIWLMRWHLQILVAVGWALFFFHKVHLFSMILSASASTDLWRCIDVWLLFKGWSSYNREAQTCCRDL